MTKEQIEKIDEVRDDINVCVGALIHLEGQEMLERVEATLIKATFKLKLLTCKKPAAVRILFWLPARNIFNRAPRNQ